MRACWNIVTHGFALFFARGDARGDSSLALELAHVHLTTSPPPKSGPFSGSTSPKVSLRRAFRLRPATGRCNDLWPAEEQDEKFDEERLWCRPEDDSKTNTDSEAVAALEFMLAFI